MPRKECNRKQWGEKTNTREEIKLRDLTIYDEYNSGTSKKVLAEKYFLSEKSIDRIILKERNK